VSVLVDSGDVAADQMLLSSFLELLNDADQVIKSEVIPPLIASGDFFYLAPSVEILSSWLSNNSNSRDRVLGLRVLAKTGSERLVRTIVRFLEDPDPIVRRQAAGLVDDLTAQTPLDEMRRLGMQTLAALLHDKDESVRLAAVYGLGRFNTKEASQALMVALEDKSFRVRRQACTSMSVLLQDQLEKVLEQDTLCGESAAFILSLNNHSRARKRAVELMDNLITDTYILMLYRLSLKFYETPGIQLLSGILRENEILLLDRCFWLLSALSTEEQSLSIRRALETEESLKRANALEALESLTAPALARRITPLFIHKRATQAIEEWMSDENLKPVSKWDTFFQLWPQLIVTANATPHPRQLPLSDDDGWLQAATIFSLVEIEGQALQDQSDYTPIDKNAILEAVKSTVDTRNGVVQETVRLALNRLLPMTALGSAEVTVLSTIEKVIFLKEVPFFASMSISQLRILASISEEISYDEGEEIFNEGEYGDALFVVVSGEVALQRRQTRGRRTTITRLTTHGSREYFAEMSIFDNAPHPHEAVALQTTELLIVRRDTLVSLIEHQPNLALTLLTVLSQRLREASGLIAEKSEAKPRELVDLFDRLK
jgi:CRP-like cAMP-binding protein/HEAT repeat protein